jgi:hypothetical protein
MFMGAVVVDDDVHIQAFGDNLIDLPEKIQILGVSVSLPALADYYAGLDVQGGEKRGGPMPPA